MEDSQLLRYSRHILLPELGIEGQERLRASHALVVGAGGLGCAAALYLAVEVTDDVHHSDRAPSDLWQADSLQIAFDLAESGGTAYDTIDDHELSFAISSGAATSFRSHGPAGATDVWLRRGDGPKTYRLSLRNPQTAIQIDLLGPVQVSLAGAPPRAHDFTAPRAIVLHPAAGMVDLDLVFVDPDHPGVTPQVPVRSLAFSRINEFADRGVSIVRRLSTIVGGTLYMESLNGDKRALRPGEELRFSESAGEIRTIRLAGDALALSFHGRVRGMATGSEDSPRSLMPTWLEWLRARHGLTLLWGTTVYLFGLATALVRWLKVPV